MKRLSLISVALLLSACGGGGGSVVTSMPAPIPSPVADAYYARLLGVVGSFPEDTEAGDVSAIVPTEPEDTEPPGF